MQTTRTRVNEIDLLRFIAALSVVLFHYTFWGYAHHKITMPYPWLASVFKYGYLGVELFFIISGFVILMTAAKGGLRDFFVSRCVRLYPAFWACCTLTYIAIITIGGSYYSATIRLYLLNMTMLSGFIHVRPLDGVYWTLFVEMRFYALVAVVLLIGKMHHAQTFLLFWLIASIFLVILPIPGVQYILIADYAVYFIAGATFYLIWANGVSWTRAVMIVLAWGLALFQAMKEARKCSIDHHTHLDQYVIIGIISTFFIVMLLISLKRTGFWGRSRWALLGSLTYPLYLLHETIGFSIINKIYPAINAHWLLWSVVLGMMGTAFIVHVGVEKRLSKPMKAALCGSMDSLSRLAGRFSRCTEIDKES